jgi:hypothetical protein
MPLAVESAYMIGLVPNGPFMYPLRIAAVVADVMVVPLRKLEKIFSESFDFFI